MYVFILRTLSSILFTCVTAHQWFPLVSHEGFTLFFELQPCSLSITHLAILSLSHHFLEPCHYPFSSCWILHHILCGKWLPLMTCLFWTCSRHHLGINVPSLLTKPTLLPQFTHWTCCSLLFCPLLVCSHPHPLWPPKSTSQLCLECWMP